MISGLETATGAFTATEQNKGPYRFGQARVDSASVANVIFGYTGGSLNYVPGDQTYQVSTVDLGMFTIASIYNGEGEGLTSREAVKNTGPQVDAPAGNTTVVTVPVNTVPEPAAFALFGFGAIALRFARRK